MSIITLTKQAPKIDRPGQGSATPATPEMIEAGEDVLAAFSGEVTRATLAELVWGPWRRLHWAPVLQKCRQNPKASFQRNDLIGDAPHIA